MNTVSTKEDTLKAVTAALEKLKTIGTTEDQELDELLTEAEQRLRKIAVKLRQ